MPIGSLVLEQESGSSPLVGSLLGSPKGNTRKKRRFQFFIRVYSLPYERVLGREDYVGYIARSALAAGKRRSGPVGEATAYLFDARGLVEHAVGWIERTFASGDLDGP
jgi:hypothetical protein